MGKGWPPESIINGRYRLMEMVAITGQAIVYRALDMVTGMVVAVKQALHPRDSSIGRQSIARLQREADLKLSSPYIVTVIACFEEEGYFCMVMKWYDGGSLQDRLGAGGRPLSLAEVRKLARQMAEALDVAHGASVIHRDIKPANVLIDASGDYALCDFGVAHLNYAATIADGRGLVGTPHYMSPQYFKTETADNSLDLFSLGVLLYEAATGQKPFDAEDIEDLIRAICTQEPADPCSLTPDLDADTTKIILKLLRKDPRRGYQSARELMRDLDEGFQEDEDPEAECPVCGEKNPGDGIYCAWCGSLMAGAAEPFSGVIVVEEGPGSRNRVTVPPEGLVLTRREVAGGDPYFSRCHARIWFARGTHWIMDMGSTNGTLVDAREVPPRVPTAIRPGCRIRMGDTYCVFERL